jgi:glycosyltransferase involved in cell wall biosynthesis
MKIVHVISGLEVGGAERMLERLVLAMKAEQPDVTSVVISLTDAGAIGRRLRNEGVQVIELNLGHLSALPLAVWRTAKWLRKLQPDLVQSWMYRSDFIAALACQLVPQVRLVWGIRCVQVPKNSSLAVKVLIRINAFLSHILPDAIICCAEAAKTFHSEMGYQLSKMVVVANGFDFELFRADEIDRRAVRRELGYRSDDVVVGVAGRYDELKDYDNFLAAAGRAAKLNDKLKFLMIGRGLDAENDRLITLVRANGLKDRTVLLGESDAVAKLMRGMDIFCLSSRSEGFPNVVVEAMATALPCIVTDVGDAALIVSDCGAVVPPRDASNLANAIVQLSTLSRDDLIELGRQARISSQGRFSLSKTVKNYSTIYREVTGKMQHG